MKIPNYWIIPAATRVEKDLTTKVNNLIQRVCESYEVSNKEIKSKRRLAYIVEPRKVAMYIMHKKYNIPSVKVGKEFNKDHATVLHSCKSIAGFMEFDKQFKNRVNNLI